MTFPIRPAGDGAEAGPLITKSRRWWRYAAFPGTFRRGNRGMSGERGLWGGSVYNEIEKVVAKGRFPRHLPVNENQKYRMGIAKMQMESGARHLTELQRLIRQHSEGERQVPLREPDLLIILTGGRMAYTRPDGVKVIPLGCLKNWMSAS